jgi:omega-6 fatty acid desaturase (delta-12 desaturase)
MEHQRLATDRQVPTDITRTVLAYQKPSRARSIWQLVNTLIPYAATWVAAYYAFQFSFWLALPMIFINGGLMIRTFILFHDCGHQAFFKSKKANDIWGNITGVLTYTPYYYWHRAHAKHHATSANLDKRGYGDVWMMTVDEYLKAPRKERLQYRLYRNPFVMFLLGPLFITLVTHRLVRREARRREKLSVYGTNLGIFLLAIPMIFIMGWKAYLTIQLLTVFFAHVFGIWLFYVQHQFEGVYWSREDGWNFVEASLEGGSFYELPAVLRWFTGNIGYHHVHHLNPRIPNYNLPRCHTEIPALHEIRSVKLFSSLKSLRFRLWDEETKRMVSFGDIKDRLVTGKMA